MEQVQIDERIGLEISLRHGQCVLGSLQKASSLGLPLQQMTLAPKAMCLQCMRYFGQHGGPGTTCVPEPPGRVPETEPAQPQEAGDQLRQPFLKSGPWHMLSLPCGVRAAAPTKAAAVELGLSHVPERGERPRAEAAAC